MSSRRGDRYSGGGHHDDDDPRDYNDTNPDGVSRALVTQKRRSLLVRDPAAAAPLVAAKLPAGMASTEQLNAFRELRTRLLAMAQGVGLTHFTTLVVSLGRGSGGSFVARNLAAAFTLEDDRFAVLVDCNHRHPTQHLALGARADDGGLFDFLDNPHPAIERIVRPTGINGLHLVPAGRPSGHREYFSSQAMRMVMAALRQEPCFVVLDGPAAKGSPDARILADLADFVVLVVGYGRDTSEAIAQTAGLFDPAKFAGVVFNERA